jgi:predicted Fe-Mo cluster-binding NifX family protein
MTTKVFIPLYGEEVAPRFDLATEVLLGEYSKQGQIINEKVLLLPGPSAERLCQMILSESVKVVICGGIEQEFYDYLSWKHISVIDNIIGTGHAAFARLVSGQLNAGDILGA